MPRRIYKKPHRAKRKKPLWSKPRFWQSLFWVSTALGGFWLVCFSPALEVKDIEIAGARKIDKNVCAKTIEDQVAKKIALFDSKSILLFDVEQAKKDLLARFPQAQNIKIEREFPSKIIASVEERRAVAQIAAAGKYYNLDQDGVAFEEAAKNNDLLEISTAVENIAIGQNAMEKDHLAAILRLKGDIDIDEKIKLARAIAVSAERINLQTADGWQIYFNPLKDAGSQSAKLLAVLADESFAQKRPNLEYIDIRFTRVYLKEKSPN